MSKRRVIVVGGGAAGFFAAITAAQARPDLEVQVFERGPEFLSKVRISGGGRCNVTHACFDPRALSRSYPRGEQALIGPFTRFQATDTISWFETRGVPLKREEDGRMFPVTDNSGTIIDCLMGEARRAGVRLTAGQGVDRITSQPGGGFKVELARVGAVECDRVLLATGGCRGPAAGQLAESLGHTLVPPVPSLFTFHIETPWLRTLPGVTVETVEASVPGTTLRERGPMLVTHWGLSGPVILRLSAWGARELHALNYRFPLQLNWLPDRTVEAIRAELEVCRQRHPARQVVNTPLAPLPGRLWEQLVLAAGIAPSARWASLPKQSLQRLAEQLSRTGLTVGGKSLNKDEFVTCGGVALNEIRFKTMESRVCPGLYFAGELLDIDGITGGFNFQAAWTTGWIAGQAMAEEG